MKLNTIIEGDCLEVLKTLPDGCVDCVVTSPPYNKGGGRSYGTWKNMNIRYGEFDDNIPEDKYQRCQKQIIEELLRVLKRNGSIFYNHKPRYKDSRVMLPTDFVPKEYIRQLIIWERPSSPNVNPITFMQNTEYIFWLCKDKPKFNKEYFNLGEVWRINPEKAENQHPAPFPEELPIRCILATTDVGDLVLDPYMGSGTTAVAAKQLGRNYIGIELNESYIKIAEQRLAQQVLI